MPGWNVEQKENSSPALMDLEIASCQAFHPSSLPSRPRVLPAASVQAVGWRTGSIISFQILA